MKPAQPPTHSEGKNGGAGRAEGQKEELSSGGSILEKGLAMLGSLSSGQTASSSQAAASGVAQANATAAAGRARSTAPAREYDISNTQPLSAFGALVAEGGWVLWERMLARASCPDINTDRVKPGGDAHRLKVRREVLLLHLCMCDIPVMYLCWCLLNVCVC